MSFKGVMELSPGADILLNSPWVPFIKQVIDAVTNAVIEIIKMPGMCPVGDSRYDSNSGALKRGHHAVWEGEITKQVVSDMDYWKWVVINHRVLTTTKALRWWFGYFLKKFPDFQRKTQGAPRWVPADKYQLRAVDELLHSGIIRLIVRTQLSQHLGGGIR